MRIRPLIATLAVFALWAPCARAAIGPAFVVDHRITLPGDNRIREFHWSPKGGRLAAITFNQVVIVDAATGKVDSVAVPGLQQIAWSPGGNWIAVRALPARRTTLRDRKNQLQVIAVDGAASDSGRVRTLADSVVTQGQSSATIAWMGPDLIAWAPDSVWAPVPVVPGASAQPGMKFTRTGTSRFMGAGDRMFLAEVNEKGEIVEREIPAPAPLLSDLNGRASEPVPIWWSFTCMSPDGAHLLVAGREPDLTDVYMIITPDGQVEHRFADGLVASDLSADGRWLLTNAVTSGTQNLEASELFLVRVSDGRDFPITGTIDAVESSGAFEPGGARVACLDEKNGSVLIGHIEGMPKP